MKTQGEFEIKSLSFPDDGKVPNHPTYPLLIYKHVFDASDNIEQVLNANNWGNSWRGGVFAYHHYHSNAHEVLVVDTGHAELHLGGVQGEQVYVEKGDVLVLPAGFGHKFVEGSDNFAVVGAYPNGAVFDLCTGDPNERERHLSNIKTVSKHNPILYLVKMDPCSHYGKVKTQPLWRPCFYVCFG